MTTHIYLTRHGETDYNIQHIVQGRKINSDINSTGRNQSCVFFEKYRNVPFDCVYTSSLKRTHQSTEPFVESGIKRIVMPDLDEMDFGSFEGSCYNGNIAEAFASLLNKWNSGEYDIKAPNGESPQEVANRLQSAMQAILSKKENNILICLHGRAIRILLSLLIHGNLNHMQEYTHDNLTLTILEYNHENQKFTLKEFNKN